MGCLTIDARRTGEMLTVSATRASAGLSVSCALVCSVSAIGKYVDIQIPGGVIFLTEENGYEALVKIESNTVWRVE